MVRKTCHTQKSLINISKVLCKSISLFSGPLLLSQTVENKIHCKTESSVANGVVSSPSQFPPWSHEVPCSLSGIKKILGTSSLVETLVLVPSFYTLYMAKLYITKEAGLASWEGELFFHCLLTCRLPWLNADKFVEILQLCWKETRFCTSDFQILLPRPTN